jgi:NAD(P)-dependent dehydrogenase (short-subunit alcohol dehydrogenase family)
MHEIAPFNIGVTIVEPGDARTNFRYQSSKLAPKIDAYEASPAIHPRRMLEEGTAQSIGDPAKMAAIIIESAGQIPAPLRLVLGSDSYNVIHRTLTERLAALEAQKELAFSTDFPAAP